MSWADEFYAWKTRTIQNTWWRFLSLLLRWTLHCFCCSILRTCRFNLNVDNTGSAANILQTSYESYEGFLEFLEMIWYFVNSLARGRRFDRRKNFQYNQPFQFSLCFNNSISFQMMYDGSPTLAIATWGPVHWRYNFKALNKVEVKDQFS